MSRQPRLHKGCRVSGSHHLWKWNTGLSFSFQLEDLQNFCAFELMGTFFPLCIARRRGNLGQHSINFWGVWREFDLSNHSMIWANVRSDRKMYVSVRQVTGLEIMWPQAEAGGWHCDRSIWRYPHRPVAALLCHPSPILNMPAIFHKNWNAQWQDIHIKISRCVHFYM